MIVAVVLALVPISIVFFVKMIAVEQKTKFQIYGNCDCSGLERHWACCEDSKLRPLGIPHQ